MTHSMKAFHCSSKSSKSKPWTRPLRHVLVLLAIVAFGVGCDPPTLVTCDGMGARSGDRCLGFSDISVGPTIDASIGTDGRWDQGFRYVFEQGNATSLNDGVMQGVEANDTLYLSFEVNNDPSIRSTDKIKLAFDPTGADTLQQMIVITPFSDNQPPTSAGPPQQVDYLEGVSGGGWTSVSSSLSWLANSIQVRTTQSGTNQREWYVELGLPISSSPSQTALHLPQNDDFGLYVVLQNARTNPSQVVFNKWPPNTQLQGLRNDPPAPSEWGNGNIGRVANGVSISNSDISVSPGTASEISLNQTNTFTADVENWTTNAQGAAIEANSVNATFRILDWGLPSQWNMVPGTGNPTASQDIPSGTPGTKSFQTQWTLDSAERSTYQNNPHQCIRVDLDSEGANTLLVNRQAWTCMKFVNTNSPFEDEATVGTVGYELPGGMEAHEFLLQVSTHGTPEDASWETEFESTAQLERQGEKTFRLRVAPDTKATLSSVVTPPEIEIPRRVVNLGTNPQDRVRIPVEPGNLITFHPGGELVLRPGADGPMAEPVGPAGREFAEPGDTLAGTEQERAFLLQDQHAPESRSGALIGSFDGFDTSSFPVGGSSTIKVPSGAQQLTLAVNDHRDWEKSYGGNGYRIEVMQTPPKTYFAHADSRVLREELEEVLFLPLGINLPSWEVQAFRRTGRTATLEDDRSYEIVEPIGSYGYLIKQIGDN